MNSKKVVLLDVFSYSCMNCLRSMEFIKKIDAKYRKYGVQTIIVHPPEWEFEKDSKNIVYALKKYKINFPVIIDKNKKFIRKLKINFWPTRILIRNGKILYKHVGEGNYKKLEDKIIRLLKMKIERLFEKEPGYSRFPTVYCGKKKHGKIKKSDEKLDFNAVYVDENWIQKQEYIKSLKNNSSLTILTKGKIINLVAESLERNPIKIKIILNNKFLKTLRINKPQLYIIIKLSNKKQHILTLITKSNLAIYSFSFQ